MLTDDRIKLIENPKFSKEDIAFQKSQKRMDEAYEHGAFEKGLQIALDAIERFPEKPTTTHLWAASFYASLGRTEETLSVLNQGFQRGAWWSADFLIGEFEDLKDHPTFSRLREAAQEKLEKEKKPAKPELVVRTPTEYSDNKRFPLLLVLHGANSNNADTEPHWTRVQHKRQIFMAFLQSSQPVSSDHYVWNNKETALRDIESAYSTLESLYSIDTSKVILAGISAGAEIAMIALFSGRVSAKGFIAVIPSTGTFIERFVKPDSLASEMNGVKGCIIAGEKDPRFSNTKIIHEFLTKKGVAVQLYSYPELGHSVPEDFDHALTKSVRFVLRQ